MILLASIFDRHYPSAPLSTLKAKPNQRKGFSPSDVFPFCEIQLAQRPITPATSKLLFVQMQLASMASSESSVWRRRSLLRLSLSVSLGSMSQVLVRSTIGWQMVVHAEGTSSARSSSARAAGMTVARAARRVAECMLRIGFWTILDLDGDSESSS